MESFVDVAFPMKGERLPLDHGYALFAAVSRTLPVVHKEPTWGLFPVHGKREDAGILALERTSALTVRVPASRIGELLPLAGQTLMVDGHKVTLGIPKVYPLQPRPALRSRFVTIKKFHESTDEFSSAIRRQLDLLGVSTGTEVAVGPRRVAKISSHTIVGFVVGLSGLTPDESLRVQATGIGGRRHMGAGLFLPLGKLE